MRRQTVRRRVGESNGALEERRVEVHLGDGSVEFDGDGRELRVRVRVGRTRVRHLQREERKLGAEESTAVRLQRREEQLGGERAPLPPEHALAKHETGGRATDLESRVPGGRHDANVAEPGVEGLSDGRARHEREPEETELDAAEVPPGDQTEARFTREAQSVVDEDAVLLERYTRVEGREGAFVDAGAREQRAPVGAEEHRGLEDHARDLEGKQDLVFAECAGHRER